MVAALVAFCLVAGGYAYTASMEDRATQLEQSLTDAFTELENRLGVIIPASPDMAAVAADTGATATGSPGLPHTPPAPGNTAAMASTGTDSEAADAGAVARDSRPALIATRVAPAAAPRVRDPETPARASRATVDESPEKPAPPDPGGSPAADPGMGTRVAGSEIRAAQAHRTTTPPAGSTTPAAVRGSAAGGPWIINLLSATTKTGTEALAGKAAARGIRVEINKAIVKDREYWRLQITGFASAREARDYAESVKRQLGIREVWIFRQS